MTSYLIETERLVLRPFEALDAVALARVFADPYAARFYPGMSNPAMAERWIARNLARYEADGFGLWAACLRTTGELVGDGGLTQQKVEAQREVEIGYHVRADQRGRGLATEVAAACREYGFNDVGCARLVSMVHPDNLASRRVAARIHTRSRRFQRLGDRYYLYSTDLADWHRTRRHDARRERVSRTGRRAQDAGQRRRGAGKGGDGSKQHSLPAVLHDGRRRVPGHYDVYAKWIGEAGTRPPQSLLGVTRLVTPDLMVEIEATAGA